MMTDVTIVLPERSQDTISNGLRKLTATIGKKYPEKQAYGLLGGEDGYGCEFENSTFHMHPQCWCDDYDTCKVCQSPNFVHHKSGLEIEWYKWIGRSMEFNKKVSDDEWEVILKECLESLEDGKD